MSGELRFVTGEGLSKAIREVVAVDHADLAVAFWGDGAAELIGMPTDASGYRIACDAFSGACSPAEMAKLLQRGAKVFDVRGLHAKVYLGDEAMVVGSANASSNGIDAKPNAFGLEAGLVCSDPGQIAEAKIWLSRLIRDGNPVLPADVPDLDTAWGDRSAAGKKRMPRHSFLEKLRSSPEWFVGRRLRVVVNDSDTPSAEVEAAFKVSPYFQDQAHVDEVSWPYYWGTENWVVAEGDLLLDFLREGRDSLRCTGVWRVVGWTDNKSITPVAYVDLPLGLRFPQADLQKLGPLAKRSGFLTPNVDREPLDVMEFARRLPE